MPQQNLADSVRIPINYAHYLALQAIDLTDFSLVMKKVKQEHEDYDENHLKEGVVYLKRYYALHVLDPLNPPAMSKPVDPFWHTHVLFSEDYFSFCDRIFGEYIHHIPLLYEDKRAVEYVADMYDRTHKRHSEIFGTPDSKFFAQDGRSSDHICCSPKAASRLVKFVDIALFPEEKLLKLPSTTSP